ncbi:MAG: hypothetical protein JW864_16635, partial [Spirochaetes bacterium]|nr:hypothetical protein [Spirochaetota bacterium]
CKYTFLKEQSMKYLKIIILFFIIHVNGCVPENDSVMVKFSINGTASNANIEYTIYNESKSEVLNDLFLDNTALPWELEFKLWSGDYDVFEVTISAEKTTGDSSNIQMQILIDGEIHSSVIFDGAYEKETIQARVTLDGYDF